MMCDVASCLQLVQDVMRPSDTRAVVVQQVSG
jgi:hypothetical protein